VSSSMDGVRISQLKQALQAFLDHLNAEDKFNIVTFGTTVIKYQPDLVAAGPNEIAGARSFVNQLSALGLTNIDAALQASLTLSFSDTTSNNVIFLTDGYPTLGELRIDVIVDSAVARNQQQVRIFPFGIGDDISKPLLIDLARRNGGFPTYVTADDSIALVVTNHIARVSKPVLSNLSIDLGGLQTYDRYPVILSDLFWGSQVLQMGRYTSGGTYSVTLNGNMRREPFELTSPVSFGDSLGSGLRAVARLWAKSKIDHLLEQIEIYGELDELVNAVIDLSIRFGILTKYTALYSDPTSVKDKAPRILPKTYVLNQNYPNPFNPDTKIVFFVPPEIQKQRVVIKVFDLMGRLVRILFDREVGPGRYEVRWDGRDSMNWQVPSGTYIYRLEAGPTIISKKMTLVR